MSRLGPEPTPKIYVFVNGLRMPHNEATHTYIVRESESGEVHLLYEANEEIRYCRNGRFYSKG